MSGFYAVLLACILVFASTQAQEGFQEQLTDMDAVKDALLQGFPLRFYADFDRCDRTPLVSIPGIDVTEPSDFGTVIDSFRGLRDITGVPIQLTFTATEVILFPGVPEHVIVHNHIEALPDNSVNVVSHYIQRLNVTEIGSAINNCKLNDGTNGQGVYFYKNTLFTPVPVLTYTDLEASFQSGYAMRYQAAFSRCGEFNTGTDAVGGGLMSLYYFKKGEKIISTVSKFYNSPFALNKYVFDTFKVDVFTNLTMHIEMSAIGVDDFAHRYTQEVFNCVLNDPPTDPNAVIFRMEPRAATPPTQPTVRDATEDISAATKPGSAIAFILSLCFIFFSF